MNRVIFVVKIRKKLRTLRINIELLRGLKFSIKYFIVIIHIIIVIHNLFNNVRQTIQKNNVSVCECVWDSGEFVCCVFQCVWWSFLKWGTSLCD